MIYFRKNEFCTENDDSLELEEINDICNDYADGNRRINKKRRFLGRFSLFLQLFYFLSKTEYLPCSFLWVNMEFYGNLRSIEEFSRFLRFYN
jgi:hypothetical protein